MQYNEAKEVMSTTTGAMKKRGKMVGLGYVNNPVKGIIYIYNWIYTVHIHREYNYEGYI